MFLHFHVYFCRSGKQKCLLRLNIRAIIGVRQVATRNIALVSVLTFAIMGMVASVLSTLTTNRTIPSSGSVKAVGVGVYSDNSCTNAISSIDWGMLEPGAAKNFTIYIKNEGNTAVTLSMKTGNWNPPSASTHIMLKWNREAYTLSAGSVISAVLTLSVSSNISGITSFNFEITITGTA